MPEPLTPRQHAVLAEIARYYRDNGEPPAVLYLARRLGLSRAWVREVVEALCRKGWLRVPAPAGLRCQHVPEAPAPQPAAPDPTR